MCPALTGWLGGNKQYPTSPLGTWRRIYIYIYIYIDCHRRVICYVWVGTEIDLWVLKIFHVKPEKNKPKKNNPTIPIIYRPNSLTNNAYNIALYDKLTKLGISIIQTTLQSIKNFTSISSEPITKPLFTRAYTLSHAKIVTNITSAKPNAI